MTLLIEQLRRFGSIPGILLTAALLISIVAGLFLPRTTRVLSRRLECPLRLFGRRRVPGALFLFAVSLLLSGLFYYFHGFPPPRIHDEFSHLLLADTLAHGRLANPTHPLWTYFESPHILHIPRYVSVYPPGNGLALAAAKVLFGNPALAVVLITALLCAALFWALAQWMPAHWAFVGGLMAVCFTAGTYWATSYWGGSLAALAGSILIGVIPGLLSRPRWWHGPSLGISVLALANTRPFMGALLCSGVALYIGARLLRKSGDFLKPFLLRQCLPATLILACGGSLMLLYFAETTGSPWRSPYQLLRQQYHSRRFFIWQDHGPVPAYRHLELAEAYRALYRDWLTPSERLREKFAFVPFHFLSWNLYPLLALPWIARTRGFLFFSALAFTACAGTILQEFSHPHYLAPFSAVLIAIYVQGLRQWRRLRWRGVWLARPVLIAILGAYSLIAATNYFNRTREYGPFDSFAITRERILNELINRGGRHLVLVRYDPGHPWDEEWVYNGADIDGSPVIWARDTANNQPLLNYYRGRTIWLVYADRIPLMLRPYHAAPLKPPLRAN